MTPQEALAAVERVQALADEWDHKANGFEVGAAIGLRRRVAELRAALTPAERGAPDA